MKLFNITFLAAQVVVWGLAVVSSVFGRSVALESAPGDTSYIARVFLRNPDGKEHEIPYGRVRWRIATTDDSVRDIDSESAPKYSLIRLGVSELQADEGPRWIPGAIEMNGVERPLIECESVDAVGKREFVAVVSADAAARIRIVDAVNCKELRGSAVVTASSSDIEMEHPGRNSGVTYPEREYRLPLELSEFPDDIKNSSRLFVKVDGYSWVFVDLQSIVGERFLMTYPEVRMKVQGYGMGQFFVKPWGTRVVARRNGAPYGQWEMESVPGSVDQAVVDLVGLSPGFYDTTIECNNGKGWVMASQTMSYECPDTESELVAELRDQTRAAVGHIRVSVVLGSGWYVRRPILLLQQMEGPLFIYQRGGGEMERPDSATLLWSVRDLPVGNYRVSLADQLEKSLLDIDAGIVVSVRDGLMSDARLDIPAASDLICEVEYHDKMSKNITTPFDVYVKYLGPAGVGEVTGWQHLRRVQSTSFDVRCPAGIIEIECEGSDWTARMSITSRPGSNNIALTAVPTDNTTKPRKSGRK